jgi:ketosteroid isomerase-like protein
MLSVASSGAPNTLAGVALNGAYLPRIPERATFRTSQRHPRVCRGRRDTARAMSQENTVVVREVIESNRSDYLQAHDSEARIEAALALWDPSCEYTSVTAAVEPETYRGHDGLRRYLDDLAEFFEEWQNDVEEIFDVSSDTVFATIRLRVIGKGSGARAEARLAAVFVLSKGKIVRGRTYPSRDEALEAAGLRE